MVAGRSPSRIIFDMDGVITSEDGYWRAAECALLEFAAHLGCPSAREAVAEELLPWRLAPDLAVIARVKGLLITTNWDLCHLAAISLAWQLCRHDATNIEQLLRGAWEEDGPAVPLAWPPELLPELPALLTPLLAEAGEHRGYPLLAFLAGLTGRTAHLFARQGPIWSWLFRRFQEWFNGRPGRRGIIEEEPLLLPPSRLTITLDLLTQGGWRFGIATGRTREELLPTLARFDLLRRFEAEAIVTHDEVAAAERELRESGTPMHLSKPHPFPFLRALHPGTPAVELLSWSPAGTGSGVVIVGDTAADMAAARLMGATAVGVLTGPGGASAQPALLAAGADHLLPDLTHLPDLLL